MDDKAKVEQENGVKYHPSLVNISHKMVQLNLIERNYRFRWITKMFEFFAVCTKLAEMAILYSKDLTSAKKVTSNWAQPDATDYYWFRSSMPNQMSQAGIHL